MNKPTFRTLAGASCAAVLLAALWNVPPRLYSQGTLTPPPGAPAPTMKTLNQVEARTPVDVANVPGDATYHHIMNAPGSYYLTGNLAVTKPHGIDVRAAGVTIDLNGFEIRRTAGFNGRGIEIDTTSHRCTVRNGSISGFEFGIECFRAVGTGDSARGGSFLQVTASDCSNGGLVAGTGSTLSHCTAYANQGSYAIRAGQGSTLSHCTAVRNNVDVGIYIEGGSAMSHCTAERNIGSSLVSYGIFASNACALTACTALSNGSTVATITASTGIGIFAGDQSTVTDCTSRYNIGDGIRGGSSCRIDGCTLNENGVGTTASGLSTGEAGVVTGCSANRNTADGIKGLDGCAVKDCAALGNTRSGIDVTSGVISDCSARFNQQHGIRGDTVTVSGCTVAFNSMDGINTGNGATVSGCTANTNSGDGIETTSGFISGNNCRANSNGAGIHVTGREARVEANNVSLNGRGIDVDTDGNLIIRNSATRNPSATSAANYDVVAGNKVGPIITDPAAAGSTNPWANFSY